MLTGAYIGAYRLGGSQCFMKIYPLQFFSNHSATFRMCSIYGPFIFVLKFSDGPLTLES